MYAIDSLLKSHLPELSSHLRAVLALWVEGTLLGLNGCQDAVTLALVHGLRGPRNPHTLRRLQRELLYDDADRHPGGTLHKGIFWAGIGGCVRIGGPTPGVAGPGAAGATVTGVLRAERPPGGGRAGGAGRGVRRTEAAGVWRERWRSAMRVPRRGRG